MGVTCITQWPISENRSVQQTVEVLTKRLDALGAAKVGNFCVDCETYQSAPTINPPKLIHVMRNKEQPLTCYAVTDTRSCLVCENSFDGIMQRLKGFYTPKKSARIESKGQRYELGDFVVKIGIVSIGPHTRGMLVEVEYTPCVIVPDCWNLLTEFMEGFMGSQFTPLTTPPLLANKQDIPYTPKDTIFQYLDHFDNFRKGPTAR